MRKLIEYAGCNGGSKVSGVSYFWMIGKRGTRPVRVADEVYMRRLREKLKVLATWARVMRDHLEQRRRKQKARERWGRAIEKVRRRVREQRENAAAEHGEDDSVRGPGERPSEGRGAARGEPVEMGAYRESREWTRRVGRQEPKRRMMTKDGARVGIRMWWWLAAGGECSVGPIGMWRPRMGDG